MTAPGRPTMTTTPTPVERKAHIALDVVWVNNRWMRQRCGWCGEILLDYDMDRTMVPGCDGDPPASWPIGSIVMVEEKTIYYVMNVPRLPAECCASVETKRLAAGPSEAEAMDAEGQTIAWEAGG
jgi:hypothetical protein